MAMILLDVRGLSKSFGGLQAVREFSFTIKEGLITSLIGPNGAGKTTVFNLITGYLPTSAGEILFKGQRIHGSPSYRIAQLGIVRTFQMVRIFPNLNVLDNVAVALKAPKGESLWGGLIKTRGVREESSRNRRKALELLEQVGLADYRDEYAVNLGFGQQKLVEIARAMATDPELLLLDEPTAGLSLDMTISMQNLIRTLKDQGKTVLFVEHDMKVVMGISDWIYVLNYGEKIGEGPPDTIRRDQKVIQAYLGTD